MSDAKDDSYASPPRNSNNSMDRDGDDYRDWGAGDRDSYSSPRHNNMADTKEAAGENEGGTGMRSVGMDDKGYYSPTDSSSSSSSSSADSSPKHSRGDTRDVHSSSSRNLEREEEIKGSDTNMIQFAIQYCESTCLCLPLCVRLSVCVCVFPCLCACLPHSH